MSCSQFILMFTTFWREPVTTTGHAMVGTPDNLRQTASHRNRQLLLLSQGPSLSHTGRSSPLLTVAVLTPSHWSHTAPVPGVWTQLTAGQSLVKSTIVLEPKSLDVSILKTLFENIDEK
ncbi:hypothetical protein ElyMa_001186200 [Elysia marginata]|uniref:Uncharacterized protein n=1 Tax=Elysia marginata TaxID=1093978 RepID=A0AAV4I354_9GAST|nr:hypothetical protein ElyMa_001186200 [Elysia marginata]